MPVGRSMRRGLTCAMRSDAAHAERGEWGAEEADDGGDGPGELWTDNAGGQEREKMDGEG